MTPLYPKHDEAISFLQRLVPAGPWVLTAIRNQPKAITTDTFFPDDEARLRHWLGRYAMERNVYFQVNPPAKPLTKKAQRADIARLARLHVDIDPRPGEDIEKEQARALSLLQTPPEGVPRPSCIIFSGGGYQALWQLGDGYEIDGLPEKYEYAKLYNLRLEQVFGADHCHNVDRILRLPGTINWPDERKAKKGRIPALTYVVEFTDAAYPLDVFTLATTPVASSLGSQTSSSVQNKLSDLHELDQWNVPDKLKVMIADGLHPSEPKHRHNSRSERLFEVCCGLKRCNVPDDVCLSIITDARFRISESVLDKGTSSSRYATRQVERATLTVTSADLFFQLSEKQKPLPNQHNIRVALKKLGSQVTYDEFQDRLLVGACGIGAALPDDVAMTRLYLAVEAQFGFRPAKQYFYDVVEDEARRNRHHPVHDYLDELEWDGTARLNTWLTTYGGAIDIPYTRSVGAIALIAAVRRVRQPGCKFDEMLVLESAQGMAKSSALAALAVRDEWFSDDLPLNQDTQRTIERMSGRWIIEAAELKGLRRGDIEHLKSFLSRRVDRARLAYGRLTHEAPRQCIIIGTTNDERYLRDGTGNRRFWPVRVGEFDVKALKRDRDQLWAEAAAREANGESIRLNPALWDAAGQQQDTRCVEDPFVGRFQAVLGSMEGKVRAEDTWAILGIAPGHRTQDNNARLGEALRTLGWERVKLRFGAPNPEWAYARGDRSRRIVISCDHDGEVSARYEGEKEAIPF
jgi:hypothetical protein